MNVKVRKVPSMLHIKHAESIYDKPKMYRHLTYSSQDAKLTLKYFPTCFTFLFKNMLQLNTFKIYIFGFKIKILQDNKIIINCLIGRDHKLSGLSKVSLTQN